MCQAGDENDCNAEIYCPFAGRNSIGIWLRSIRCACFIFQQFGFFAVNHLNPAATIAPSDEFTDEGILSFLPSDIVAKLSAREKSEAASAQFFALQYGRVGATREWTADSARVAKLVLVHTSKSTSWTVVNSRTPWFWVVNVTQKLAHRVASRTVSGLLLASGAN